MLSVAFVIIPFGSFQKENTVNFTVDDAAAATVNSIESTSGGIAEDISTSTEYDRSSGYGGNGIVPGSTSLICGAPYDTPVSYALSETGVANFTHSWIVLLNCIGGNPSSISWTGNCQGNLDDLRLSGSSLGTRNWTLTGIDNGFTLYNLNCSTTCTGSRTSKVPSQYSYDVTNDTTPSNLTVNQTNYQTTSVTGTGTATLMQAPVQAKLLTERLFSTAINHLRLLSMATRTLSPFINQKNVAP